METKGPLLWNPLQEMSTLDFGGGHQILFPHCRSMTLNTEGHKHSQQFGMVIRGALQVVSIEDWRGACSPQIGRMHITLAMGK
jgi:hypothetical protein